jgi:hypothetical protein
MACSIASPDCLAEGQPHPTASAPRQLCSHRSALPEWVASFVAQLDLVEKEQESGQGPDHILHKVPRAFQHFYMASL